MIIFDQEIAVHRQRLYSSKGVYGEHGTIHGIILPIKAEDVILTEGDPSKQYKLIADINVDLLEADKVICEGETYIVKTIKKFNFRRVTRLEAYIYKSN